MSHLSGFTTRVTPIVLMVVLAASCIRIPNPSASVVRAQHVAIASPASKTQGAARDPDVTDVMIWLIADPLHTGLVFPYDWLLESGFVPPKGLGHPRYVTLSWGERTAYVQRRWLTPWQIMRAFFTPSPSVMEVIPFNGYVVETCPQQRIWRKSVPRDRGPQLAAFLNDVCRLGPDGKPIVIGPSSWGHGVLLESGCSYHLPRICNVWTVQALEACGCSFNPWLALTANSLIRQAETPRNGFENVWLGKARKSQE